MKTTITEALATLKTIGKRIEAKRHALQEHCAYDSRLKDPMDKAGGSEEFWKRETQAIADLQGRYITIRTSIQRANSSTTLTIRGVTRSIAGWLIWKRDIAPSQLMFMRTVGNSVRSQRDDLRRRSRQESETAPDLAVSFNESEFLAQTEEVEALLADLDGQLSLFNARTEIEVPD
jgi:hypothetical protein